MRLYKFNTIAFGDLTLPTKNARSQTAGWGVKVGILQTAGGFRVDINSGVGKVPKRLTHSGSYILPDAGSAYDFINTSGGLDDYVGLEGTLYRGYTNYADNTTWLGSQSIAAMIENYDVVIDTNQLLGGPNFSIDFELKVSFTFLLLEDSWGSP